MMKLMTIKLRVTGGAQRAQAEEDCCIQRYGVMMESILYMELSGICSPEKPRFTKITILPRFFVAQQEAK